MKKRSLHIGFVIIISMSLGIFWVVFASGDMEMPTVPVTHKNANRLINENSPYLLQHAHNPVDWYPWGPEALNKAQKENKPIFLNIGYAACHWCHVMEHESFEDSETATLMNELFWKHLNRAAGGELKSEPDQ